MHLVTHGVLSPAPQVLSLHSVLFNVCEFVVVAEFRNNLLYPRQDFLTDLTECDQQQVFLIMCGEPQASVIFALKCCAAHLTDDDGGLSVMFQSGANKKRPHRT